MNVYSAQSPMPLNKPELDRIAKVVCDLSGIEIPFEKKTLVQARLARSIRRTGVSSFAEYCRIIEDPSEADERAELLSALTTNVTRFFREKHHFDHLVRTVLPKLEAKAQRGAPIHIWSAAASTGEEPYSIALALAKAWPKSRQWNIKILATDIDPAVIAKAKIGSYRIDGQDADTLAPYRAHFNVDSASKTWVVTDQIKQMISFETLNLHDPWRMTNKFDVVFCRNVVIYFNEARQNKIWDNFSRFLNPDGALYIGHSERIEACEKRKFELDGVTTYRKLA